MCPVRIELVARARILTNRWMGCPFFGEFPEMKYGISATTSKRYGFGVFAPLIYSTSFGKFPKESYFPK